MQNTRVMLAGSNFFGQLAFPDYSNNHRGFKYLSPSTESASMKHFMTEKFYYIVCSSSTTWFMAESGNIWRCGMNKFKQLGDVSEDKINEPKLLHLPGVHVKEYGISCGDYHTHIMTTDGRILSAGRNNYGQCGLTKLRDCIPAFTAIPKSYFQGNTISNIVCGEHFSLLQVQGNNVNFYYALGCNKNHQFGVNLPSRTAKPGKVLIRGHVKQISAGSKHSVVLTTENRLFYSGCLMLNNYIQHELLTHSPITRVFSGCDSSIFETVNNTLEVIGGNLDGKLFVNKEYIEPQPAQVEPSLVPADICDMAIGRSHVTFTTASGNVYTIGKDSNGQLGIEPNFFQAALVPTVVNLPLKPEKDEKIYVACHGLGTICYVAPRQRRHYMQSALFKAQLSSNLTDLEIRM